MKLADYEASDLPERTKAALRLADRLAGERPTIDPEFLDMLARHFTGDELIDLGMTLTFASGSSWRSGSSRTAGATARRHRSGHCAEIHGGLRAPPKPPVARGAPAQPWRPTTMRLVNP